MFNGPHRLYIASSFYTLLFIFSSFKHIPVSFSLMFPRRSIDVSFLFFSLSFILFPLFLVLFFLIPFFFPFLLLCPLSLTYFIQFICIIFYFRQGFSGFVLVSGGCGEGMLDTPIEERKRY